MEQQAGKKYNVRQHPRELSAGRRGVIIAKDLRGNALEQR